MVNIAVCSPEGSGQKAVLMATINSLASFQMVDGHSVASLSLQDRQAVSMDRPDTTVNFYDVSRSSLEMLMYNAFNMDIFLVTSPSKDPLAMEELKLLRQEIGEKVPNTKVIIVESGKRRMSMSNAKFIPVFEKVGPDSDVEEYIVKCNISRAKEVLELARSLSRSVFPAPPANRSVSRDETDTSDFSSTNRLPYNSESSNTPPELRNRRIGRVAQNSLCRSPLSRPRMYKNKKDNQLFCNCKELRRDSDDFQTSNEIVSMTPAHADLILTPEYINNLRLQKMNLSLLAVILCHPVTLDRAEPQHIKEEDKPYTELLCGRECIDEHYEGENLLHILAKKNCQQEVAALFQSKHQGLGLQLARMKTEKGFTPISVAVRWKHHDLASLLIREFLTNSSEQEIEEFVLARNCNEMNILNSCCHLLQIFFF